MHLVSVSVSVGVVGVCVVGCSSVFECLCVGVRGCSQSVHCYIKEEQSRRRLTSQKSQHARQNA